MVQHNRRGSGQDWGTNLYCEPNSKLSKKDLSHTPQTTADKGKKLPLVLCSDRSSDFCCGTSCMTVYSDFSFLDGAWITGFADDLAGFVVGRP